MLVTYPDNIIFFRFLLHLKSKYIYNNISNFDTMSFIHNPVINYSLRTLLHPFRKLIPEKFYFAINGTVKINLNEGKSLILSGNPTSNLIRILFWMGVRGFEYDEYKIFIRLVKRYLTLESKL